MPDYSSRSVCIVDNGLFVELAVTLAKSFGRVYYFSPWVSAFPRSNDLLIGRGIPGVRKADSIWPILDQVDLWCFDDQTEVLTEHGWRRFADLDGSESVATLRSSDRSLEYQRPTRYIRRRFTGEMVTIETARVNLCVTPQHRLYVRRQWRKEFGLELAATIAGRSNIEFAKSARWTAPDMPTWTVPAHRVAWSVPHWTRKFWILRSREWPEATVPTDAFLALAGFFLAEGSVGRRNAERASTIEIGQKDRQTLCDLEREIAHLGVRFSVRPRGKQFYVLRIHDAQWATYFERFGKNAADKHIPAEIKALSARQLKILWDWYMRGDGLATGYGCSTVSRQLAHDLSEIALKIGYSTSERPIASSEMLSPKTGRHYRSAAGYRLNVSRSASYQTPCVAQRSAWRISAYDGDTYCVSVPNGVIYVRRHGVAVWAGNCFPDIYDGPLQEHLVSLGKRVWGSRHGEELELDRVAAKEHMRGLGIPVGPYQVVRGLDNLRAYLRQHPKVYVKISRTRGDFESFRSETYDLIEPKLDELEHTLGAKKKVMDFIVEEAIDEAIECYDKDTEVLTTWGWRRFERVRPHWKVATLNPATHEIEYHRAGPLIRRRATTIWRAKRQKVDLAVTGGHALYVRRPHAPQYEFIATRDLAPGTQCQLLASGTWKGRECETFDLPAVEYSMGRYRARKAALHLRMDDWLTFLGWFFSEGCALQKKNLITISQSAAHPDKQRMIEACLDRLPFHWNKNGQNYRIHSRQLYGHLWRFSRKGAKNLPRYLREASPRQIRLFLDAFFAGDGTVASNGVTKVYAVGVDRLLADQLQELILKAGAAASVITKPPQQGPHFIGDRRVGPRRETYLVSEWKTTRPVIRGSDFVEEPYDDWVYCLNVPNHTLYVRRHGIPAWSGNCGYDGFTVNGQFPTQAMAGIEVKDKAYVGLFQRYAEMPPQIRMVNERLAPTLKRYGYRNFLSVEMRITKDGTPWVIDPCCRLGAPPNELCQIMYTNWPEILWYGAQGELVDPIPAGKWGAELLLLSSWADQNWQAVAFPERSREQVKLRNLTIIEGRYYVVPRSVGLPEIGAVVAVGDTMDEAIRRCREIAETVEGYYIEVPAAALDDAEDEIEKLKAYGISL